MPYFTTALGKGVAKENSHLFCGSYLGAGTDQNVAAIMEESDCVLRVKQTVSINLEESHTTVGYEKYEAKVINIMEKLKTELVSHKWAPNNDCALQMPARKPVKGPSTEVITHQWLWQRLTGYFRAGDLIYVENGTAQLGISESYLLLDCDMCTQAIYGSIGYAAGASVGRSIAGQELGKYKRIVLITGEGSLQLTVQAMSLLSRYGITPVIYTVERILHGLNAPYNDVDDWSYGNIFKAMGSQTNEIRTFAVKEASKLDDLLASLEFNSCGLPAGTSINAK
ncbi:putative Pyruvate decarboxylase [Seiridium cardinale]|uniref:Pyruvate decarboxylase n=1 Tax=Seiridium cardinale TaxID=138064 RepID=A0ABR2XK21_9PEZI